MKPHNWSRQEYTNCFECRRCGAEKVGAFGKCFMDRKGGKRDASDDCDEEVARQVLES